MSQSLFQKLLLLFLRKHNETSYTWSTSKLNMHGILPYFDSVHNHQSYVPLGICVWLGYSIMLSEGSGCHLSFHLRIKLHFSMFYCCMKNIGLFNVGGAQRHSTTMNMSIIAKWYWSVNVKDQYDFGNLQSLWFHLQHSIHLSCIPFIVTYGEYVPFIHVFSKHDVVKSFT